MSHGALDAIYRNRRLVVVVAVILGGLVAVWLVG